MQKSFAFFLFLFLFLIGQDTFAQTVGAICTAAQEGKSACHVNGCYVCKGLVWMPQALIVGSSSEECLPTKQGGMKWESGAIQFCNGTAWTSMGGGSAAGPAAFSFENQNNVVGGTKISSNTVVLSGFSGSLPAVCGTGCVGISKNGGAYDLKANFSSGDTISILQKSATSDSTMTTAVVKVGGTTSGEWSISTGTDPCNNGPSGTACSDGSLYVGKSLIDDDVKLFAARCDWGLTWDGSSCTGTRVKLAFTTDRGLTWANSHRDGMKNSLALDKFSTAQAAKACLGLTAHGKSDWYFPALLEMHAIWVNAGATAAGVTSVFKSTFLVDGSLYWASTEAISGTDSSGINTQTQTAYAKEYSAGGGSGGSKWAVYYIRCMRK